MCSQFCFLGRWKLSTETQRYKGRQSLRNPLDIIWMYSKEICTPCSFQYWNKTQPATSFTPALCGLAGDSKKQGLGLGQGQRSRGQVGAQDPPAQRCPCCCCSWLSWILEAGWETPLIHFHVHSGTKEMAPITTVARLWSLRVTPYS